MVVDVYVCGLFTNSRHNESLRSTGTWPRLSWPSEASVPDVSWASRHLLVQGRLALEMLAPSLVARALALRTRRQRRNAARRGCGGGGGLGRGCGRRCHLATRRLRRRPPRRRKAARRGCGGGHLGKGRGGGRRLRTRRRRRNAVVEEARRRRLRTRRRRRHAARRGSGRRCHLGAALADRRSVSVSAGLPPRFLN